MRKLLLSLCGLVLFAGSAEARPHGHRGHHAHHGPRVVIAPPVFRVVIDPWGPEYRPAPRAGYAWVEGHYSGTGRWIPGHWRPVEDRPGFVWVAGHWVGGTYVEGTWRELDRPGYTWVDGGYNDRGDWVEGYWAPVGRVDERGHVEAIHHDYE